MRDSGGDVSGGRMGWVWHVIEGCELVSHDGIKVMQ